MTDREDNVDQEEASSTPPADLDWEQEKTKVRVRQFMNILEQLPRLCSPTICGTLSQPTTKSERMSRGADMFEWSLEQKAILSPANITTDTDGTDEWQNAAELNLAWRQQESETFFSQRTIAPSPLTTPRARTLGRPIRTNLKDLMYDEEEEEIEFDEEGRRVHHDEDERQQQAQDLTTNKNHIDKNQSSKLMSYEFEDDTTHHCSPDGSDTNFDLGDDDEENNDDDERQQQQGDDQDDNMDNLFFSPQPLASSQTQQRMDIFSPDTFVRTMEDENTLQSTPKTTGSLQRTRTRTIYEMMD